jgi:hypothetical protein
MAEAFAKKFYDSVRWRRARLKYINQRRLVDGALCEICKTRSFEEVSLKNMQKKIIFGLLQEINFFKKKNY